MYSDCHYLFQIQFDQSYTLRYIRMMQRTYEAEQFKDFTFTFEDGSTQDVRKTFHGEYYNVNSVYA